MRNQENLSRAAALILALSIPLNLAGCTGKFGKDEIEPGIYVEKNVKKFTPEDLTNFLVQMSAIIPTYNLEEIYLSEEEIETVMTAAKSTQDCDNDLLESDDIFTSIISNSTDESGMINITYDISASEKQELDANLKECLMTAIDNLMKNHDISLEDACVMKKLKIVIGENGTNACLQYNPEENTLVMDYLGIFNDRYSEYHEQLRKNLTKEATIKLFELALNYCRLQTCSCRLEKGQVNTTIDYTNSLNCFNKCALYSGDMDTLGDVNRSIFDDYYLESHKHNMSLILLEAAFKENRNIEDLYKIMFSGDLKAFHEFFGLTTPEDIERFYKTTRSIEIQTTDNEYQDEFYSNSTSTMSTAFRNHVGYAYKIDIFKTAIGDLMKYAANHQDLSKEEMIFLYKYVKYVILNNSTIDAKKEEYDPEFAMNIISIENIFFDFMSKMYGVKIENLDDIYEDVYIFQFDILADGEKNSDVDGARLTTKFPLLGFIAEYYESYSHIHEFDEATRR